MQTITLTRPDDWHVHLRDGAMLNAVANFTARQFGRAVIMPNLKPPITTVAQALAYRQRVVKAIAPAAKFTPLMTLYLTESTPLQEIDRAAEHADIIGVKLYPAGATTHSDAGVGSLKRIWPLLERMQQRDLPLLIHGEVTDADCDIFDRESVFIERELVPLRRQFPELRIVLEHITTAQAADYIRDAEGPIAATITPQHLLFNRNHLLVGGIKPHYYCLPVLKRAQHQQALLAAATSGNPRFFLGTDSAPHRLTDKHSACGCAGCFSAPQAMAWYAQAFAGQHALSQLEGFASVHGADFYRLPRNTDTITLTLTPNTIPEHYGQHDTQVVPLGAGQTLNWQLNNA
ncbi:MAG: dihydroorotase [Methylococcales bacterium]|nr:dihydroorotase [Methylococcales bacterium]